jgi:hypothetical protein
MQADHERVVIGAQLDSALGAQPRDIAARIDQLGHALERDQQHQPVGCHDVQQVSPRAAIEMRTPR